MPVVAVKAESQASKQPGHPAAPHPRCLNTPGLAGLRTAPRQALLVCPPSFPAAGGLCADQVHSPKPPPPRGHLLCSAQKVLSSQAGSTADSIVLVNQMQQWGDMQQLLAQVGALVGWSRRCRPPPGHILFCEKPFNRELLL